MMILGKKLEDYRPWTLGATLPRIIIITPKIRCCLKQKNISEKIILIILISFLKKRTNLFFNDYLVYFFRRLYYINV